MSMRIILVILILCCFGAVGVRAQDPTATPDPMQTVAFRDAPVYSGPGNTYTITTYLRAEVPVTIVERNNIGNWLHVTGRGIDGWVMSGYLRLSPGLRFSQVSVSTLPDASVETLRDETLHRLYSVPIISEVSDAMIEVYERGQELGNDPHVVSKVGDSLSADPLYFTLTNRDDNVLGPYDYLNVTLSYFGPSTPWDSIAARVGMASYVVGDPQWADAERCVPNESPLACEYRNRQPAIALVMFGPNDVRHVDVETFEEHMRLIIEELLGYGVIPVLSTFSTKPGSEYWERGAQFNLTVIDLAEEYEVPLINLWSAASALPDFGLDGDDVHMRHSGFRYLKFDTGHESWYGVSLRNLLTLRMLEELRSTLKLGQSRT